MDYNQNITLDLNTDNSYVVVGAKQGDTGRKITVNILQDGQPLDLSSISSNLSATYRVGQPNGGGTWADIPEDNIRTSAGTVVVIDLRDVDLGIPGRNIVDILLKENIANSGEEPNYRKISTVNFVLNVMAAPNIAAGAIKSEPFQYLEEIVEATETADYWADQAHMWANGKAAGADTPSATNNSKYYADQAEISKEAAVTAQGHAEQAARAAETSAEAAAEIAVVGADAVLNAYPRLTASGAVASTSVGANDIPLERLVVQIVPSQDSNEFDAPWIGGSGVNKFGGEIKVKTRWKNGSYLDNDDVTNNYAASETKVNCTSSTEYRIVLPDITQNITFFLIEFGENGNYLGYQDGLSITAAEKTNTFTTGENTYSFALSFFVSGSQVIDQTTMMRCAINYPSTETDWTPYENIYPIIAWTGANVVLSPTQDAQDGTTYTLDWTNAAGAVGGSVKNENGRWKLTVTHRRVAFNDANLGWDYQSSSGTFRSASLDGSGALPAMEAQTDSLLCSCYKPVAHTATTSNMPDLSIKSGTQGSVAQRLYVKHNAYTDTEKWLESVGGQTILYPLATPVEIGLTAESVKSLLGSNYVWADTGDVTATFRCDPNLYIAEGLEPVAETANDALNAYPTEMDSGEIASTTIGADNIPLKSLTVNIAPIQSGSGDPSPTNIRSIGGWTGAHIATFQGENLIGGADMAASMKRYVPSTTIDADNVATFYTAADRDDYLHFLQLPYKENTQYTFILTVSRTVIPSTSNVVYRLYYTDGTFESIGLPANREENTKYTVVRTSAPNKTVAYLNKISTGGYISIYCNESGVFEGVLTAADFVPYIGRTTTVPWQVEAGTVYGGTLNVLTGILNVTFGICVMDGVTNHKMFTYMSTASNAYCLNIDDASNLGFTTSHVFIREELENAGVLASNMPVGNYTTSSTIPCLGAYSIPGGTMSYRVLLDASITSIEEANIMLKNWYDDGKPLTFVYPLKNPVTYQLLPTDVESFLGDCNIWADTGDVEVVFRCDPNRYIDSKISSSIVDAIEGAY